MTQIQGVVDQEILVPLHIETSFLKERITTTTWYHSRAPWESMAYELHRVLTCNINCHLQLNQKSATLVSQIDVHTTILYYDCSQQAAHLV